LPQKKEEKREKTRRANSDVHERGIGRATMDGFLYSRRMKKENRKGVFLSIDEGGGRREEKGDLIFLGGRKTGGQRATFAD